MKSELIEMLKPMKKKMNIDMLATDLLEVGGGALTQKSIDRFFKGTDFTKSERQLIEQKAMEFLAELSQENDDDMDPAGGYGLDSHV